MKSELNAAMVFLLSIVCLFFGGYYAGRHSIAEDCDMFSAFKNHSTVYECKAKQ